MTRCLQRTVLCLLLLSSVLAFVPHRPISVSCLHSQRSLLDLNETYRPFDGRADIVTVALPSGKQWFIPSSVSSLSSEQLWERRKLRKSAMARMREAIAHTEVDLKPYFEALKPFFVDDQCDVLQAHSDFFQALSEQDITLMASLWSEDNSTVSIRHDPRGTSSGGSLSSGYEDIIQTWQRYFSESSRPASIETSDVQLFYYGDMVVVTFLAEERTKREGKLKAMAYFCTNVYQRAPGGRYLLTTHTSSPLPSDPLSPANSKLRLTYRDPSKSVGLKSLSTDTAALLRRMFGNKVFGSNQDEDSDDEDDEDEEDDQEVVVEVEDENDEPTSVQELMNTRIKNTIRQAVTKFAADGKGGPAKNVMIIGGNGMTELLRGGPPFDQQGDREEDGGDEDDDDEESGKVLASRTLAAVKWLHSKGRITTAEKRVLTSDIIRNVDGGRFSRAEVAYSVIVGDGRPGEWDSDAAIDLNNADEDDMKEFAQACRALVRRIDDDR